MTNKGQLPDPRDLRYKTDEMVLDNGRAVRCRDGKILARVNVDTGVVDLVDRNYIKYRRRIIQMMGGQWMGPTDTEGRPVAYKFLNDPDKEPKRAASSPDKRNLAAELASSKKTLPKRVRGRRLRSDVIAAQRALLRKNRK